jgi:hypothetical protein
MNDMRGIKYGTTAGDLTVQNVGDYLAAVNGVHFARPVDDGVAQRDIARTTGLLIEGVDANFNPYPEDGDTRYVLVTVWMGPAMQAIILNRDDSIVLE